MLADIYLGKISNGTRRQSPRSTRASSCRIRTLRWSRARTVPARRFIFTNYLSKVSAEWKDKAGNNTSVKWPAGVSGKGNEGVAAYVQRLPGSIGYVEYAYAMQNKMAYALLQNKDGNFVAPDDKTFRAAAANAQWDKAPGFYLILTDQPGKESWPITGATFILMHKKQDKPENAAIALKFFDWAYEAGDKLALDLDYVPMPDSVVKLVKAEWKKIQDASGKPVITERSELL